MREICLCNLCESSAGHLNLYRINYYRAWVGEPCDPTLQSFNPSSVDTYIVL